MKAVVWHGPRHVRVDEVDDPRIEEPTDAVIRVTATGLGGSDLQLWEYGAGLGLAPGDILGHEPMGEVLEVGPDVHHIKPGDAVVVPASVSCGHCFFCQRRLYSQCEIARHRPGHSDADAAAYQHLYGGVYGAQAEYLRVPQAHFGPIPVDDEVPELAALLLSDVLPTAWQAVQYADIPPGGTVAVYGLGPIGLMCARMARYRGAGRVIAIDTVADRLRLAAEHAAEVIDYATVEHVVDAVHELTGGRGADSVIDAVGMAADGSQSESIRLVPQSRSDRMLVLRQALGSVRRGGTVSIIGIYSAPMPAFPLDELFDKQVTLRCGQANARRWTDDLLAVLRAGDPLDAAGLVTTQVALAEAPGIYEKLAAKEPGVVKVALRP